MSRIALLIGDHERVSAGNYLDFSNYMLASGHEVVLALVDTLSLHDGAIEAQAIILDGPLLEGTQMENYTFARVNLEEMDLVWVLALGLRPTFLDKIQLLYNLARNVRVVNSVDALMYLKSKYFLTRGADRFAHPETHASSSWEELHEIVCASDTRWVLKPAAGSFGRDVFLVSRDDSNLKPLLQNMTAHDKGQYCILQRYVEEIAAGEKRVLIAGGDPVGQYLRHGIQDHRSNVAQGSELAACDLTEEEHALCARIGEFLVEMGALFAGIDLAYPWLIEVNVVSPGGIESIRNLTSVDLTGPVVDSVLAAS